jgi:hypothetical protein
MPGAGKRTAAAFTSSGSPRDEIESHPAGGLWNCPLEQGGGSTPAYPWELWRYRHLEGLGENVEIEFVETTGAGECHITNDPCEKDAAPMFLGSEQACLK